MGYRLTKTDKWDDKWFRSLGPLRKILFIFMCDKCDLAGFYEIDIEDMAFRIKADEAQILEALKGLNRSLDAPSGIKDGEFVWLRTFLLHQKNLPLNPSNNIYKQIVTCFEQRGEFGKKVLKGVGGSKGLQSPIGVCRGKGKGKEGESEGKRLMENSGVTLEDIRAMFLKTDDMKHADAKYYYDAVSDWSISKSIMRTKKGWISTTRNSARRDLREDNRTFMTSKEKAPQKTIPNPYE